MRQNGGDKWEDAGSNGWEARNEGFTRAESEVMDAEKRRPP